MSACICRLCSSAQSGVLAATRALGGATGASERVPRGVFNLSVVREPTCSRSSPNSFIHQPRFDHHVRWHRYSTTKRHPVNFSPIFGRYGCVGKGSPGPCPLRILHIGYQGALGDFNFEPRRGDVGSFRSGRPDRQVRAPGVRSYHCFATK
jgi:hypothetical protein